MQPAFLVGYDGSRLSELSLHQALVRASRSESALVHAVIVGESEGQSVRLPRLGTMSPWAAIVGLRHLLSESLTSWGMSDLLERVRVHIATGEPGQVLVELVPRFQASSVSVGLHSRSEGANREPGAVARYVARHALCAVHIQSGVRILETNPKRDPVRACLVLGDAFRIPGAELPRIARA